MSFARVITVVTAAFVTVLASASTASAATTTPDTWAVGESITPLEAIALFIGGPLLLLVGIWAVAAAVVAKSRNFVPTIPDSTELEKVPSHDVAAH